MRACELIAICEEDDDATLASDLVKAKAEMKRIRDEIQNTRAKAAKEKKIGATNVVKSLMDKVEQLQNKIVSLWKSYDSKHGTNYHMTYA